MYFIKVNNVILFATTHYHASDLINREIVRQKLQSNMTTRNIVSNWICRKKKSKKWDFIQIEKI